MPYQKILLASDGSEHALKAATHVAALAMDGRVAQVTILGVAVEYAPLSGRNPFMQAMQTEAELAVEATAKVFEEKGLEPVKLVRPATGNPGHVICAEAERLGADLIVMGSRGHGPAASLLVGSASMHVVHCSSIPVLLVR